MWEDMGNVCSKLSDQFCQSIFGEENLAFLTYYFEVTTIARVLLTVGFGEYGEMWQDVGRYGERLLKKLATNFVIQYSTRII